MRCPWSNFGVNAKRTARIVAVVTPSLRAAERVELVGRARISSGAANHPATAPSISSSAVIADGRPRSFYVVLTAYRLIMVRRNRIVGQVLRDCIAGVTGDRAIELTIAGRGRGLLLVFVHGSRSEGERIGAALARPQLAQRGAAA
jgi:hypothetical protein